MSARPPVHVIDSHTAGEPTRVVIAGGPELGQGSLSDRLARFRSEFDGFRAAVVCEPRGPDVVVGALLLPPCDRDASAAVIFFNDVGYLGMCGHGVIGVVTTLAHLGRIGPGLHRIETPAGTVTACLHKDGCVTVANVPSYRFRAAVSVDVPGLATVVGDIAWGGNWFFLVEDPRLRPELADRAHLIEAATTIREALRANEITGKDGHPVDHIEFIGPPADPQNSARNFVLCPGASFDRSPCGTGTSAKIACLYADGRLAPRQIWRQEGILGTVFEGYVDEGPNGAVNPSVRGRAWITGETQLLFAKDDPFSRGIRF